MVYEQILHCLTPSECVRQEINPQGEWVATDDSEIR
jgi:hypothetical protein